jgi:lipopolysaccharide/colanic/teichoic acid biosynthesis glycosyltransferase
MVVHAERDHGPRQAAAGDARVTRIGRLMRATAMNSRFIQFAIFNFQFFN